MRAALDLGDYLGSSRPRPRTVGSELCAESSWFYQSDHSPNIALKCLGVRFHMSECTISVCEAVNVMCVQLTTSLTLVHLGAWWQNIMQFQTYVEHSHFGHLFFFFHLYYLNTSLLSQAVTLKPEKENGIFLVLKSPGLLSLEPTS